MDEPAAGRLLALCCLPRTNPGNRTQYVRRNGPVTLVMNAGGTDYKLPYGNIPRLLLAYICTEAVRTQSRVLLLGDSVSEFMRKLDIYSSSGEKYTRLGSSTISTIHPHTQVVGATTPAEKINRNKNHRRSTTRHFIVVLIHQYHGLTLISAVLATDILDCHFRLPLPSKSR